MTKPRTISSPTGLEPSALLRAKLAAVRRKQVGVAMGTGLGLTVGTLVVGLGVFMLLDWWLEVPRGLRALALVATLGFSGWIAWRRIFQPWSRQPDDDAVALAIERARPELRSRLISSVQFARPGAVALGVGSALARQTILETEELVRPVDYTGIISTRELRRTVSCAVVVLALGLFVLVQGGSTGLDLLQRAFLSGKAVPRHTRVEILTTDTRVGRGDTVKIEALARGVVPAKGRLLVKSAGQRGIEYVLERGAGDRFLRPLENVQESFDYVVRLNDGVSRSHHVEVLPRPGTATIECEQVFPAYTGLPKARRALGDLSLLAGSRLTLSAQATHDLRSATLRLAGLSNDLPLKLDPARPRELRAEISIPARGLTGFSFDLTDTTGLTSRDPAVYRIDVVPDRAPKVRITYPDRREELVTRQARQPIGFEAGDDFRLARARLRYRVGESEEAEIQTIDLDLGTNVVKELRNVFEWNIRDFRPALAEGTRVEYWVEVEDNNDVTGPGLTATEHQLLRVVSENEKRADLLNRAGDFIGTIGDVAGDQEKLNANLGALILERPKN